MQINLPEAPNFNFNVSHEGHFVVLASEPHTVCGVDCAAPSQLRRGKPQTMDDIYKVRPFPLPHSPSSPALLSRLFSPVFFVVLLSLCLF
jgi:hypothetical protein